MKPQPEQPQSLGEFLAEPPKPGPQRDRGVHRDVRIASRSFEDHDERLAKHAAKLARRAARAGVTP